MKPYLLLLFTKCHKPFQSVVRTMPNSCQHNFRHNSTKWNAFHGKKQSSFIQIRLICLGMNWTFILIIQIVMHTSWLWSICSKLSKNVDYLLILNDFHFCNAIYDETMCIDECVLTVILMQIKYSVARTLQL